MSAHRRAARPYRGGKRRVPTYDFSTPEPHAEPAVGAPGTASGPGHVVDLAYNPAEARDRRGRWTETAASALNKAIHGDVAQLETMVHADQGPTRIKMPQLSGVPIPGSKADALPHAPGEEVDLTDQFEAELRAKGYTVEDTAVPTRDLKPTQDQLVMPKVAGLAHFMLNAPPDSPVWEPIFVSEDDHVIDGHHRWAARTVKDEIQGHMTDRMPVRKIDVPIAEALRLATEFMDEWGLPRQGTTASASPVISHFANLSNIDLVAHDVSQEARDTKGKWIRVRLSLASLTAEKEAQAIADKAFQKAERVSYPDPFIDNPDVTMEVKGAPKAWGAYQCQMYTQINHYLRTGEDSTLHDGLGKASVLAKDMDKAFDEMGYTTKTPITLYRVEAGEHVVKASDFKVGQTYTDKGVISTGSDPDQVAGFLDAPMVAGNIQVKSEHAFLLQIRVPTGTRVLGGYDGGIETMLRPGTKFKVVAVDQPTAIGSMAHAGSHTHHLPMITVEVQP